VTTSLKNQFMNDVLAGLIVAATFTAAAPHDAMAQLAAAVDNTRTAVFQPMMTILGYGCYGAGTFFGIQGVMGAKKHADRPTDQPLGPALGKLATGAALVAIPSVISTVQATGTGVFGGSGGTANPIQGF
jgi:hypothetical protein